MVPPPAPRRSRPRAPRPAAVSAPIDARSSRHEGDDPRDDDAHHPDDDRGLLPELEREELDQPFGGRIEGVRPTGEEDRVERREQRVEGDERDDATDHERSDQDQRSATDRSPRASPVPAAAARRDREGRHGRHGRDGEEPDEHATDVAHVTPFPLVEHGFAGDRDVEVGRAEHQVGQDRVRGASELGLGKAGPRGRLGATLLEGDPDRVQEQRQDDRDDRECGRKADQGGGGPAAERFHASIVVRRRPKAAERGFATRPRAFAPGSTSPRS